MVRWVEFVLSQWPDFIWRPGPHWLFSDFQQYGPETPRELFSSAFLANAIETTARAAEVLGEAAVAARHAALLAEAGVTVLLCPGPGAEEAHAREHYPAALALGGVSLGVYNALLQRAALVVANDTGPAHMAAAVGARLLSVLGPTEPEMWGPWGPNVEVLRRQPEWFSAEEVLQRVLQRLAAAAG